MSCINPQDVMLCATRAGSDQYYTRIANPPIHPGDMHAHMPEFYLMLDQRRIRRVPRPPYFSPPHETATAITFHAHGWPGVRVRDFLKNTIVIDSPNDPILAIHGWRSTVVNLQWPGYDPQTVGKPMLVRIQVQLNGHITRQGFAREICALLLDFHKRVSRHPVNPGWEEWALTAGPEGIRLTDVVLLSVHYYRNVWVPEFYVIE